MSDTGVSTAAASALDALTTRQPGETGTDVLARAAEKLLVDDAVVVRPDIVKARQRASKFPKQIAVIVYCRLNGMSNSEIAEALGVKPRTVSQLLYRARTEYGFSDIVDRVQHHALPQAVENMTQMLEEGDREMTLETLKGLGVFKKHVVGKEQGGGGNGNVLRVEFALPEGVTLDSAPVIAVGGVIANPRVMNKPAAAPVPALPAPVVETVDAVS